jgi:trans-aconitate methyltransferase
MGSERVLDLGCGDGKVTAEISRCLQSGRVVGIDSSTDMIRFACRHFPQDTCPNLSFAEMDVRDLNFEEEFDVVFSNAALHWVLDHRPVLAGIRRALCPGGRLLIQMGDKGNAANAFRAFDALIQEPRWGQYFTDFSFPFGFFSDEEYASWIEEAGFVPVRTELIPKIMVHKTRDDFAGWIRTTWLPYLERIPEPLQPEFIDSLIDRYLLMYPANSHGEITLGMVRLEAEAKKPV